MDKVVAPKRLDIVDFVITRKKQLTVFNLNDFLVDISIGATSPLIQIDHQRVTISAQKKITMNVELLGEISKPEAIMLELEGDTPSKKFIHIQTKDEKPWNLVSLTPVLIGFFVMELIISGTAYFSPEYSVSPWFHFFFGLILMFVQFKCWPLNLKTH